jgi:hypothetical protein
LLNWTLLFRKIAATETLLPVLLSGDASRSARNSAGTAAAAAGKKARHATSMASPLISAARTDLVCFVCVPAHLRSRTSVAEPVLPAGCL